MIEPHELRIGNRVMHYEKEVVISGITDIDVFIKDSGDVPYCELLPIDITEQHLIDAGFEKTQVGTHIYDGVDGGIELVKRNDKYYPVIYEIGEVSSDGFRFVNISYIQYIHELQNLFFAITKEELL